MKNWKNLKLGDVLTFKRGYDLPQQNRVKGKIPIYSSAGLSGFHNQAKINGPGVITGRYGTLGEIFYTEENYWPHNTTLYVQDFKGNHPKFIFYFLKTLGFNDKNDKTSVPGLNRNHLHDLLVSIPEDISVQIQIAKILSSLDDKIELNRRMNQTLEQMAKTLFQQYFINDIDEDNLPNGWKLGLFEDLVEFNNGNAFKSTELLDCDEGDCLHVFKMGHIKKGGGFNSEGTKSFLKKSLSDKLKKYILKKGDLLMCMTDMKDNVALLGHTALMNEDDKFIVNQRVGLIRAKNNLGINYPYLYLLTNSISFLENLRNRANSGVQVNLSTSEIKNSEVIIPPKELNEKFDKTVMPLFKKIFQISIENKKLTDLRDLLLPKLMSGEIDVMQTKAEELYEPVLS